MMSRHANLDGAGARPGRPGTSADGDGVLPRRFALVRHVDYTGVSGVGVVAYGVVFFDGQVALRWCSNHPATSLWNSLEDMMFVHGHGSATSVEWIDNPGDALADAAETSRRGGRRARREVPPPPPVEQMLVPADQAGRARGNGHYGRHRRAPDREPATVTQGVDQS